MDPRKRTAQPGTPRIIGIGGSLRSGSTSLAALKIALSGAAASGAAIRLHDLRSLNLPIFDPASKKIPESVTQLVESAHTSDGMIWSSPLYHGSISGSFKNALDWLILLDKKEPAYLTDKVVGLISVAGGTHGLQAINTMEFIVRALRAWAVPLVVPVPQAFKAFGENGGTNQPELEESLVALGEEVVRIALLLSRRELSDPAAACAQAAGRLARMAATVPNAGVAAE